MRHHTVTTTLATPPDEVFAYLADIERLPEWATEFARELRLVAPAQGRTGRASSSSRSTPTPNQA